MAPWTRQLGCVLVCYAPIGRRRRSRKTLVLRIRRSEGRVVNTPLVFKKGCFEDTRRKKEKDGKKPGERRKKETEKRPRERERKIREKSEEDRRKKGQESPGERERESAKPDLNGEKGMSPEIGVKSTMNAGGVEHEYMN
ncbi:hypothetical protein TNCV_2810391 [Trichonephila clavipes]|nr:hypothetical protein TNCV_2810391 [Trichonephila clavipes]